MIYTAFFIDLQSQDLFKATLTVLLDKYTRKEKQGLKIAYTALEFPSGIDFKSFNHSRAYKDIYLTIYIFKGQKK